MTRENYFKAAEFLLLIFILFQCLDIISTWHFLNMGLKEANPLVNDQGLLNNFLYKIGACLLLFIPIYIMVDNWIFQSITTATLILVLLFYNHIVMGNFEGIVLRSWGVI